MKHVMPRAIARFALVFGLTLAVLAAVWPQVSPRYASAVTTLARPVFRLVESPNRTVLDVQGDRLGVYRIVGEGRITPVVVFDRYLFFAVIPLVALLVATPGLGLRRRAVRTAGGLAALLVLHVAYLVVAVELVYAVAAGRSVGGWEIAVRVLWESAPILIWVALTAGAWKRVLRRVRAEGTEKKGSPSAGPVGAEG